MNNLTYSFFSPIKAQVESQLSIFSGMTQEMLDATHKLNELNIRTTKKISEEFVTSIREVMATQNPFDAISVTVAQTQPAVEKMRSYQQHLRNIAEETRANFAKITGLQITKGSNASSIFLNTGQDIGHESVQVHGRKNKNSNMGKVSHGKNDYPKHPTHSSNEDTHH